MKTIRAVIFDFDGVIAESVNVKTEAFAELYAAYGEEVKKQVVAYHLEHGGMPRFDKFRYFHNRILGRDLLDGEMERLCGEFSRLVFRKVVEAPYVPGAYEFISTGFQAFDQFISSGTPDEEIKAIVRERCLTRFFLDVLGSPESKADHVRKIMETRGYEKKEVVFIGDAISDRDAARANDISFIARLDGHSPLFDEKYNLSDLRDLPRMLERLDNAGHSQRVKKFLRIDP
jgi:phosphoglycolate phosphatase-like HAD superfamily hydrolase